MRSFRFICFENAVELCKNNLSNKNSNIYSNKGNHISTHFFKTIIIVSICVKCNSHCKIYQNASPYTVRSETAKLYTCFLKNTTQELENMQIKFKNLSSHVFKHQKSVFIQSEPSLQSLFSEAL